MTKQFCQLGCAPAWAITHEPCEALLQVSKVDEELL